MMRLQFIVLCLSLQFPFSSALAGGEAKFDASAKVQPDSVAQAKKSEDRRPDYKIMTTQSDGLNVVHEHDAVLIRAQIDRTDGQLKRDAILNAFDIVEQFHEVYTVHVLYGKTKEQHVYKRIDVQIDHLKKASANPDALSITRYDAVMDEKLPGYVEDPGYRLIFPDDPEHCRHGSMTVRGSYHGAKEGTLDLARTDAEVLKHRIRRFPSEAVAIEHAKPYQVLLKQYESKLR
jgi:hypothetical protein